jgi:hypothetical protein
MASSVVNIEDLFGSSERIALLRLDKVIECFAQHIGHSAVVLECLQRLLAIASSASLLERADDALKLCIKSMQMHASDARVSMLSACLCGTVAAQYQLYSSGSDGSSSIKDSKNRVCVDQLYARQALGTLVALMATRDERGHAEHPGFSAYCCYALCQYVGVAPECAVSVLLDDDGGDGGGGGGVALTRLAAIVDLHSSRQHFDGYVIQNVVLLVDALASVATDDRSTKLVDLLQRFEALLDNDQCDSESKQLIQNCLSN